MKSQRKVETDVVESEEGRNRVRSETGSRMGGERDTGKLKQVCIMWNFDVGREHREMKDTYSKRTGLSQNER